MPPTSSARCAGGFGPGRSFGHGLARAFEDCGRRRFPNGRSSRIGLVPVIEQGCGTNGHRDQERDEDRAATDVSRATLRHRDGMSWVTCSVLYGGRGACQRLIKKPEVRQVFAPKHHASKSRHP